MNERLDEVKQQARDLRTEEPRSPAEELGGFELAARCLDKCRASLVGWQGEYQYGCPMDQEFLTTAGINKDEFRDFVATGASDGEVDQWIRSHAHAQA
ncbi:MAG: uncharacterized protein JWR69_15 [Pedosphaera sp.]|nr:uncharacterized protein [Pedosphaera sp.]